MKTLSKLLFGLFLLVCVSNNSNAQSTQAGLGPAGHTPGVGGVPVRYLGWDAFPASNLIPLSIEHRGTNNINFLTGGTQRMTILGTAAGVTQGYVGIRTAAPIFPLTVQGDGGNLMTTAGWLPGVLLQNHAMLAWDGTGVGAGRSLFMGCPSFVPADEFYCGLTPALNAAAVPINIYRMIGTQVVGTTPAVGDFEFLSGRNVFVDGNVGIGLDLNVAPLFTPTNRVEINTTASVTTPVAPVVLAANGNSGALVANGFGGTGFSGLRFTDLRSTSTPRAANPGAGVLSVDANGDVIYVPGGGNANNGTSVSTITPGTVVLGQNICQVGNPGQLISDRETPMNGHIMVYTQTNPDSYVAGKVGFGISPCNAGAGALRNSDITVQVDGSLSIFDGTGNSSVFFGEENRPQGSGQLGEWGIQYSGGGLNFWKPFPSSGWGFGNNFLFLSDNGNVGIGSTAVGAPGNVLTITSNPALSPNPSPQPAGLRFTNLTSASPTTPNVGNMGVLAVDISGDVIYVPGATGVGAGYCSTGLATLIGDAGYNLSGFNFYYDGNGSGTTNQNNLVIGNPCTYVPIAKVDVLQSSNATSGTTGENILNTDQSITGAVYGIRSSVIPPTPNPNDIGYTAGYFHALASKTCIGVYGLADGLASNGTGNYGGVFQSNSGGNNIGVYGRASGPNGGTGGFFLASGAVGSNYAGYFAADTGSGPNYGVYAESLPSTIGGTNYAGWFNGDVMVNGGASSGTGFLVASDQNLKTDIDSISDALGIISQLLPKTFFFDSTVHPQMRLSDRRQYGLIAQQIDSVLPELVVDNTFPAQYDLAGNLTSASFSYKSLNYNAFIAILMKGIQEQELQIANQSSRIDSLETQMNSCCSMNARTSNPNINQTDVTLTNSESVVLDQNVPNPFAEQTTITYNLPSATKKAQMIFYDVQGKMIKVVELAGTGKGQLNVFADDLSNGIYTYALVVDGQVVDTKRMVKTQ